MKTLFPILSVLLVLVIGGCVQPVDVEAERAATREALVEWVKAKNAKDVDRVLSFFTDDASVLPPNAPIVTGKEEMRSFWSQVLELPGFSLRAETTKVEVSGTGDLAYSLGPYETTVNDPEGNPVTYRGKYVVVWRKQPNGTWKVVVDIANLRRASPGSRHRIVWQRQTCAG